MRAGWAGGCGQSGRGARSCWTFRPCRPPRTCLWPLSAVAAAVAAGDVTPEEGQAIAAVVEAHRRAIETTEIEQRLAALEAKQGTKT